MCHVSEDVQLVSATLKLGILCFGRDCSRHRTLDGTISPTAARGAINGAGPLITAVTGSGTVTFEIGK